MRSVRQPFWCCWAQAQRYIRMLGMSSSQSLTTIELFGVRVLSLLAAALAAIRWLGCGLRTLTCDDRRKRVVADVAGHWMSICCGPRRLAVLAPVTQYDIRGRRDGPPAGFASSLP